MGMVSCVGIREYKGEGRVETSVKGGRKVFLAVVMALMLNLSLVSAALAHGFAPHGGATGRPPKGL